VFTRRVLLGCMFVLAPIGFGQVAPQTEEMLPRPELRVFTNSGTVNRVAKFASDGTTVVDSNFYDVGGALGINTSSVMRMLTVENGTTPDTGMRLQRFASATHPYVDFLLMTSPATPYAFIQVGDDNAWRSLALQPNGGNVGIRTTAPMSPLHLYSAATSDIFATFGTDSTNGPAMNIGYAGASYGRGAAFINVRDTSPTAPNPSLRIHTADQLRMIVTGTGLIGIGTASPESILHVNGSTSQYVLIQRGTKAMYVNANYNGAGVFAQLANRSTDNMALSLSSKDTNPEYLYVNTNGNVGVGTTAPASKFHVVGNVQITGDLIASGNVAAKYQDVAEWVPSNSDLEPGTVVVLDEALGNGVTASHSAYDTTVAGVVSVQPGIILGEGGANKEQIATTGRVRVKVDASHAAIRVGDLLVTSDKPGYAMKSVPVDFQGIAMHRPGTIVGKALEALNGGEGEILVLLSLQ